MNEQIRLIPDNNSVPVKISSKSARQLFKGCNINYIRSICKGRCCEGTNHISVAIHPTEQARIESQGGIVKNGFLTPDGRGLCPFKTDDGLCKLHGTGNKPLGCIASPFDLNSNDTLIIRNRYRLLRCFKNGTVPAYLAFQSSLDALFGKDSQTIINHLKNGGGDIIVSMPLPSYRIITDNRRARRDDK